MNAFIHSLLYVLLLWLFKFAVCYWLLLLIAVPVNVCPQSTCPSLPQVGGRPALQVGTLPQVGGRPPSRWARCIRWGAFRPPGGHAASGGGQAGPPGGHAASGGGQAGPPGGHAASGGGQAALQVGTLPQVGGRPALQVGMLRWLTCRMKSLSRRDGCFAASCCTSRRRMWAEVPLSSRAGSRGAVTWT